LQLFHRFPDRLKFQLSTSKIEERRTPSYLTVYAAGFMFASGGTQGGTTIDAGRSVHQIPG
jgi:hypothetical protein